VSLPKPYWSDESRGLRLFLGDCRDILPHFADGEFGSVVTDPPYGVGIADWDIPPDSAILQQCLRVATGTVVMFGGAKAESVAHFAALSPRFDRMLPWSPPQVTGVAAPNGMFYSWQPVWVWRAPKKQDVIPQDRLTNVRYCVPPRKQGARPSAEHYCAKPSALMRDLCLAFGGTSVLDPYCGSGTTLAACAKLGLPCTGIEIEEKYCAMTVARLTEDLTYGPPNLFNREDEVVAARSRR